MNELYKLKNYFNPLYTYLISHYIREYDMQKSNISILYSEGIIDYPKYCELFNASRDYRQEYVGKLILKNHDIQTILDNGVTDAKEKLFKANNLEETDILCIKNDAIFVIDKVLSITEFNEPIRFVNKNTYTSFYKLGTKNAKELYYYYDRISENEILHVKGISDDLLYLHEPYFMEFLKVLFCSAQIETLEDCIEIISSYNKQYIGLELNIGNYRRFDSDCMYDLKQMNITLGAFKLWDIDERYKKDLNISYNLNMIRFLNSIFSDIYLTRKRM